MNPCRPTIFGEERQSLGHGGEREGSWDVSAMIIIIVNKNSTRIQPGGIGDRVRREFTATLIKL
jgi:hypothetical protein